jgi:hypothetical protein
MILRARFARRLVTDMAKKSIKPVSKPPAARSPATRRFFYHFTGAMVFLAVLSAAIFFSRREVALKLAYSTDPPAVVFRERPAWMTDEIAEELTRSVRPLRGSSAFDQRVLADCARVLSSSPWVKNVNAIRRVYGKRPGDTIEIDCDFRAPMALVRWQDYYWLIDSDGYKLPEQYTAEQAADLVLDNDRRPHLRILEGVENAPVESGQKWPGADLAAGLELARLLFGQRYADEIVKIDITNFAGRVDAREAQLTLVTRYGTEVRWGRPISAKDAFVEVAPARKLDAMQQIFGKFHRIDAGQPWVDIRFDQVTYPAAAGTQ